MTRKTEISIRHSVRYSTGLLAGMSGLRFLVGAKEFSRLQISGLAPRSTQPPNSLVFLPEVTWPGHDVDHSPPPRAKVKNEWIFTSTTLVCFHGVDKDNFVFTLVCMSSAAYLWAVTPCSLVNAIGISGERVAFTNKLLVLSSRGLQSRLKISRNRGVCPY